MAIAKLPPNCACERGGKGMRFACNDDGNDRHVWRFEPIPGSIGVYSSDRKY